MSPHFLDILQLPEHCILQKRLTKAFFLKHFTLSVAEKKLLNEGIEHMEWLASIKAASIPAYVTDTHSYEEVQVFAVELRTTSTSERLDQVGEKVVAMVQKYVPYPLLLFVQDSENYLVNASIKRINLNDASKRTIEASLRTPVLSLLYADANAKGFFNALAFAQLDKTDLRTLYGSYMQAIVQCRAAALTGTFGKRTRARSTSDLEALQRIDALEAEIHALKAKVKKGQALREQVDLNMAIQEKRAVVENLKQKLAG